MATSFPRLGRGGAFHLAEDQYQATAAIDRASAASSCATVRPTGAAINAADRDIPSTPIGREVLARGSNAPLNVYHAAKEWLIGCDYCANAAGGIIRQSNWFIIRNGLIGRPLAESDRVQLSLPRNQSDAFSNV